MTETLREKIRSRIAAGEAGQWDAAVLWQDLERLGLPGTAGSRPSCEEQQCSVLRREIKMMICGYRENRIGHMPELQRCPICRPVRRALVALEETAFVALPQAPPRVL